MTERRLYRLVVDGPAARTPGFTHRRINGYWEAVEIQNIRQGDIFRVFNADGTPEATVCGAPLTAVALDDAATSGGGWGVRSMPVRGFLV